MNFLDFVSEARKHFIGNLVSTVMGIGTLILVIVVVSIMLGYLASINATYLGNNTNASLAIGSGFNMINLVLGISILLIAVALLWLAIALVGGGGQAQGGRGRRGRN